MGSICEGRRWSAQEGTVIMASPHSIFDSISNVKRMSEWSPECRAVWLFGRDVRQGRRFVGWNRNKLWIWFTLCRVTHYEVGRRFSFRASIFGLPVASWTYELIEGSSGTEVTESWEDLRTGRGSWLTELLGRVFTGVPPVQRACVNQEGMRVTLSRLKEEMEI